MSSALSLHAPGRDAVATALARAKNLERPVLLALSWKPDETDVLAWYAARKGVARPGLFWEDPTSGLSIATDGIAWRIKTQGPSRFEETQTALSRLWRDAVFSEERVRERCRALCFFSFFDDAGSSGPWKSFPENLAFVPRHLLARQEESCWGVSAVLVRPNDDMNTVAERLTARQRISSRRFPIVETASWTRGQWLARADKVLEEIRKGSLEKAVLVRGARRELAEVPHLETILRRLRVRYPECALYWLQSEAGAHFAGATPERLVSVRGRQVCTMALAGTAPRANDSVRDAENAAGLRASTKNRNEHRIVAEHIRRVLQPYCSHLDIPGEPELLSLMNVHHLYTPLRGRLAGEAHVLELVGTLHPTPAVGGHPRDDALALVEELEGAGRGLYAGPLGWCGPNGDGEFVVALRGAVLCGKTAHLFAGCGLVVDSDPRTEWEESEWKLRAFESALGNEAR